MSNKRSYDLIIKNIGAKERRKLIDIFTGDRPYHHIKPIPRMLDPESYPARDLVYHVIKTSPEFREARQDAGIRHKNGNEYCSWIIFLCGEDSVRKEIDQYFSLLPEEKKDDNLREEAKSLVEKIPLTMLATAEDWCRIHWGTDKDIGEVRIEENQSELKLTFETNEETPTGIIEALSKKYPAATFKLYWFKNGESVPAGALYGMQGYACHPWPDQITYNR